MLALATRADLADAVDGLAGRLQLGHGGVRVLFRNDHGHADAEMHRVFNCGIGMIVVAEAARAEAVMQRLTQAGESPVRIGETIAHDCGEPVKTAGSLKF